MTPFQYIQPLHLHTSTLTLYFINIGLLQVEKVVDNFDAEYKVCFLQLHQLHNIKKYKLYNNVFILGF